MEPISTAVVSALTGVVSNVLSKMAERALDFEVLPKEAPYSMDNSATQVVQVINFQIPQPEDDFSAIIHEVRFTTDHKRNRRIGLLVEVDASFCGLGGIDCGLAVYFSFEGGEPLMDTNNRYRSYDGIVSVGVELSPMREEQFFPQLELFIPYSELHLHAGPHNLTLLVRAYRRSTNETLDQEVYKWTYK